MRHMLRARLQGVLAELAAREGLHAERVGLALEGGRAVDGERHGQNHNQAGRGEAAGALRDARHVAQRAELDEGA